MTNEELIATIRSEIERLKSQRVSGARAAQIGMETYCKKEAYDEVLSFISTLESEKPTNQDELEKELDRYLRGEFQQTAGGNFNNYIQVARHFYELGCTRTAEKYDEIEYNRQRAEEQGREGLEEEIKRYLREECSDDDEPGIHELAEHFAKWGADHFRDLTKKLGDSSETPNGLEEAAISRMRDPDMYLSDAVIDEIGDELLKMAQFGAKWSREQMMREAIDAEISASFPIVGRTLISAIDMPKDFKYGDKVRIIVCKKED